MQLLCSHYFKIKQAKRFASVCRDRNEPYFFDLPIYRMPYEPLMIIRNANRKPFTVKALPLKPVFLNESFGKLEFRLK